MMGRRQLSLRLARRARTRAFLPFLEQVEDRLVLSTFYVTNAQDSGPGSLRQAILDSNATGLAATGGTSDIVFGIPASTAPNLDVPVPGFDPVNQTWTITLDSPLPTITKPVTIDGYSQAEFPVPFRYPSASYLAVQELSVLGSPTGGTFTLTSLISGHTGTTAPIPYDANAATVQAALESVVGPGNATVTGGPAPDNPLTIYFTGQLAGQFLLPLQPDSTGLTGGESPAAIIEVLAGGGLPIGDPKLIQSTPNTVAARQGNDAHARVIIDGHLLPHNSTDIGFLLDSSPSTLRGLIIDGFGVGVRVPQVDSSDSPIVGDLIQGNFIGTYFVYPVDPTTGIALPAPNNVAVAGLGNSLQGVLLDSNNTTVGGTNPQEDNVIAGNGLRNGQPGLPLLPGVQIQPDATGDLIEGNQIGLMGPSTNGLYYKRGNGAEGVLDFGSSNQIGGPVPAAGNLISGNGSHGIRISGPVATGNNVAANIIGLGPGGGYLFGTGNPGNGDYGDGVLIEGSSDNKIGGPTASSGNTISSNFGSGVFITDLGSGASVARSIGNTVLNNLIGVTSDGSAAKGNAQDGVTIESLVPLQADEPSNLTSQTVIGPGNVISGNLRGVSISGPGPGAKGVVVRDNLIGTDITGTLDLGNAQEGVLIDNASGNTVTGNANGSQVISGNLRGVYITGNSSTRNLVTGNLIGSDKSGLNPLPNAQEGVRIESAGNTIGGTTAAARNLISANNTGVLITSSSATSNLVQGNYIGTDITGTAPLANETAGVVINMDASGNTIGGSSTAAGNVIAFNPGDGVLVDTGFFNSILTNSIFSNGRKGIDLLDGGNHSQPAPVLTSIQSVVSGTAILGTVQGKPSTPYTIQFFSNAVSGPEGKTFLGQISVTTDASGSAFFTANLSVALDPTQPFITATATSASGDTSEFSTSFAPLTVEFAMASYTVSQSAGTATITVVRSSAGTAASVAYATSDGTAKAGVDYVTAVGVLSFAAGQSEETFTVSIIDTQQVGGSRFLNLTLSNPTNGMVLGNPSMATLTILGFTTGPTVVSLQPISTARGITSVVLTFSEPLDPNRAVNLLNYGYSLQAAGKDQRFGTADDLLFGIALATYNASNDSVTLRMANPIHCNSFIRLTINQSTDNATVPIGVADTSGNLLDGNYDGRPGGVFTATFARGQHLSYPDGNGNSVSLSLSRGGTMILTRQANGNAWQLSILSAVPGRTTLGGHVRKAGPGATGLTPIPSIVGTTGVRVLLTDPPFVVGGQSSSINVVNPAPRRGTPIHGRQARPSARPIQLRRSFGPGPRRSSV